MLAMVLGYRYPTGAVVGALSDGSVVPEDFRPVAEPGGRAPHMWLYRAGVRLSTLDLYEQSPVLLSGPEGGAWHAAGRRLAEREGLPLTCYRVGGEADHDLAPEAGSDWAELHGTAADGAVLVRPDGFVAWRSHASATDPERTLKDALAVVLSRE